MRALGVCLALLMLPIGVARADKIDAQSNQLRRASDYKVRLSAALGLAKTRDPRAVAALTFALRRDRESTVRRVAALSLGRIVDESTPLASRKRAITALEWAAAKDKDRRVRGNASRALDQLAGLRPAPKPVNHTVYVNIGRPSDLTRRLPRDTTASMHDAVTRTVGKMAPSYATGGAGARLPTEAELVRRGMRGFYVGSTVSSVNVSKRGARVEIHCSVSLRVSPWNGRDGKEKLVAGQAASATGNGRVIGVNNRTGIEQATRDCILAVVEEVTARQVVPFLEQVVAHR